jgi:hypothetical protein
MNPAHADVSDCYQTAPLTVLRPSSESSPRAADDMHRSGPRGGRASRPARSQLRAGAARLAALAGPALLPAVARGLRRVSDPGSPGLRHAPCPSAPHTAPRFTLARAAIRWPFNIDFSAPAFSQNRLGSNRWQLAPGRQQGRGTRRRPPIQVRPSEAAFGLPVFARRASRMPNRGRTLITTVGARSHRASRCPTRPAR